MQCKAKSKRSGKRCRNHAMKGLEVCRMHGGKSLKGAAHPNYQHGRSSRYMPAHLLEVFDAMMADPEILSLNADIATQEALISQELQLLESEGDAAALLASIGDHWRALWVATAREDRQAMGRRRAAIDDLLRQGASIAAARAQLQEHTEQKRKLVDSEARRRERMQALVAIEDASLMFQLLVQVVTKYVPDRAVLAEIQQEWAAVTGRVGVARISADAD